LALHALQRRRAEVNRAGRNPPARRLCRPLKRQRLLPLLPLAVLGVFVNALEPIPPPKLPEAEFDAGGSVKIPASIEPGSGAVEGGQVWYL